MVKADIKQFEKEVLSLGRIGLDSMCFLYQFSDHPHYSCLTNLIFSNLGDSKIKAVTSTITLVETFVQAERKLDLSTIINYEKTFRELPNLKILPVDWEIARLASQLRANYKVIKTADALQLATTLYGGYKGFITNDKKLKKVKELKVICLDDYL